MADVSNEAALEAMRKDHESNRLCFLTGAAISAPSGLPIAGQLVESILRSLLFVQNAGSVDPIILDDNLLSRLLHGSTIASLRLEVLLGSTDSQEISDHPENHYADQVVRGITAEKSPNRLHRFLASGLSAGTIPAVFTTNWDTLIEQSLPVRNVHVLWSNSHFKSVSGERRILAKLHGTAAAVDDDVESCDEKRNSLVADPAGLGGPLPTETDETLTRFLTSERLSLCVVGYSGRDPDIHPALRKSTTRVYWIIYPHQSKATLDADCNRLRTLLPHADLQFIVCEMGYLLGRLGGSSFLESIGTPAKLPAVYEDLSPTKRLLALGNALSHAAAGDLALQCFTTAQLLEPNDLLVRFSVYREQAVMYRSWVPLTALPIVWWQAQSTKNIALRYDAYFYFLLALENVSIGKLRLTIVGRLLCGLLLCRIFFSFPTMETKLALLEQGSGMEWLRKAEGQRWVRLASRYIQFVLTSTRLHWFMSPDAIIGRMSKALAIALRLRSPSLQGQVHRYMGRYHAMRGDYGAARSYYEMASYWFNAIDDRNGVTEVNKYRLKTVIALRPSGQAEETDLYGLAKRLQSYESERGRLPLYVRHVIGMCDGIGIHQKFCTAMVRHVWPRVMRFYF